MMGLFHFTYYILKFIHVIAHGRGDRNQCLGQPPPKEKTLNPHSSLPSPGRSQELQVFSGLLLTEVEERVYDQWVCASPNLCLCSPWSPNQCLSCQYFDSGTIETRSSGSHPVKSEAAHTIQSPSLLREKPRAGHFLPVALHCTGVGRGGTVVSECHEFPTGFDLAGVALAWSLGASWLALDSSQRELTGQWLRVSVSSWKRRVWLFPFQHFLTPPPGSFFSPLHKILNVVFWGETLTVFGIASYHMIPKNTFLC